MSTNTRTALEAEIIRFLKNPNNPHDLPEIVRRFRASADDASIKAALHRLRAEGLLQITPDWKFCKAAAAGR
jgi:DNA-binding GntR family transcriptional regulator